MTLTDRLIDQLAQRGLSIAPGDKPGELKLTGKTQDVDAGVLDAVRAFKSQLLERYGQLSKTEVPLTSPPAASDQPAPVIFQTRVQVTRDDPETCRVCGRDVSDPEDRELLGSSPLLCDRGGSRGATDAHGTYHPPQERCPFKGRA